MTHKNIGGLSIAFLILSSALGCGDDSGLPKRYPISGQVSYNGKPLEFGTINFIPVAPDGRPANGTITNGEYSMTTHHPADGVLLGSYKVTILAKTTDPSKVGSNKLKRPGGAALNEAQKAAIALHFQHQNLAKAAAAAKDLIPAKYGAPESSGLTFAVQGQSTKANFELND